MSFATHAELKGAVRNRVGFVFASFGDRASAGGFCPGVEWFKALLAAARLAEIKVPLVHAKQFVPCEASVTTKHGEYMRSATSFSVSCLLERAPMCDGFT